MVTFDEINAVVSRMLDDETSERYNLADRVAAINWALNRGQAAFGWMLANRKGSEEALREMIRVGVWQTDDMGTLELDDPLLGHTVANIIAVYAEPVVPDGMQVVPLPSGESRFVGFTSIADGRPVHRVTHEMVPVIRDNASMRGNEVLAGDPGRRTYAYYQTGGRVCLLPRSVGSNALVSIAHLVRFTPMTGPGSTADFPQYMQYILAAWAWQFLSYKQGAGPDTANVLASRDAAELFSLTN